VYYIDVARVAQRREKDEITVDEINQRMAKQKKSMGINCETQSEMQRVGREGERQRFVSYLTTHDPMDLIYPSVCGLSSNHSERSPCIASTDSP
jgi:hypothetical protein